MNPNELAKKLDANIKSYLDAALPIKEAFPENELQQNIIKKKIDDFWANNKLVQEPFVELMPPYVQGCSLQKLVDDGVIHKETAKVFAKYFGSDDPEKINLHKHQEEAIRGTISSNENMIVCSGTGSGKTECFLIPVIDKLIRMNEAKQLNDAVYVMLLYPMNALVNDQLRRLRKILKEYPDIRFGKYTGELAAVNDEENLELSENVVNELNDGIKKNCVDNVAELDFDDNAPLPNEVTRRTQWDGDGKGHIMVTNFSMLERLLLNPKNSKLFTNEWKYIVLDEAHTYNGSLGTDMAWLMRRLANRLQAEDLHFLATSATLSNYPEVVKKDFAAKLFPAEPETFGVYYGEQQNFQKISAHDGMPIPSFYDVKNAVIEQLSILRNERNLIKATQNLAGFQDFVKQGVFGKIREFIANPKRLTIVNAVFIAKTIFALTESTDNNGFNFNSSFDKTKAIIKDNAALTYLLDMMKKWYISQPRPRSADPRQEDEAFNIDAYGVKDIWREKLHDYSSPKKSSIVGEANKPIGNNLHVLNDWENKNFTFAATDFLLQNANAVSRLLECSTQAKNWNCDVNKVYVEFTDAFKNVLNDFKNWSEEFEKQLKYAQSVVANAWRNLLGGNENEEYPQVIARYLSATGKAETCYNILRIAGTEKNKYDNLKSELELTEDDMDTLFALGSMARNPSSRFPVLDVRIHQFVRGLPGIGIYNLRKTEGGDIDFDLTPSLASSIMVGEDLYPVFSLGVCRDCGHPFVLAYADGQNKLARYADDTHKKFIAFGFPSSQPITHYINFKSGEYCDANGDLTGKIGFSSHTHGNNGNPNPEFISTACPACGAKPSTSNLNNNIQYGKITPFQAKSSPASQLQMVVIDTLAKNTEPSNNPIARGCPGEGRKLLVFSDSRQGAAKHVVRYQEYWADVSLKNILHETAVESNDFWGNDDNIKDLYNTLTYIKSEYKALDVEDPDVDPVEYFIEDIKNPRYRLKHRFPYLFNYLLVKNKLDSLLDLDDGDGGGSGDYAISCYRFLKTLMCGSKRHNPIEQGYVKGVLMKSATRAINETQIDGITSENFNFNELCSLIFNILLRRAPINAGNTTTAGTILSTDMLDEINNKPYTKLPWKIPATGRRQEGDYRNPLDTRTVIYRKVYKYLQKNNLQDKASDIITKAFGIFVNTEILQDGYINWYNKGLSFSIEPGEAALDENENKFVPVRIEEHTAQISKQYGKAFQQAFSMGKINVLSCSTTFEMGVDLGDLNCLYMSNLPPSVASYRQRAGRAGRRAGATAYVLTMLGNSDSSDDYYFDHAEKFVFGSVEPPRIYLDNPIYRARHLRAAALYKFLEYIYVQHPEKASVLSDGNNVNRKFDLSSHFFGGRILYHRIDRDNDINRFELTRYFTPLADELSDWHEEQKDDVNDSIRKIKDADTADYDIAGDLVWQICGSEAIPEDCGDVALLGGRRAIQTENGTVYEPAVQEEFMSDYKIVNFDDGSDDHCKDKEIEKDVWTCTASAYHLMQEETVSVLSKKRVLPKYGFPVDVIPLKPHANDEFPNSTDRMERVKNIAIYEYAPGMEVVANKRVFTSSQPIFKQQGNLGVLANADKTWHYCSNCKNIFEEDNGVCQCCGNNTLQKITAKNPDGFLAKKSRPYSLNTITADQKGCRVNTTFNKFDALTNIAGVNIQTASNLNGSIIYLNMGPKYQGYGDDNNRYSLYHESRTDVVYWKPTTVNADLFGANTARRFCNAMSSAASALVKAAAFRLNIRLDEISVISFPHDNNFGFIFYDETPGGNGLITAMNGAENAALIRDIIEDAITMCSNCNCYNSNNPDYTPVSFDEYQQNENQAKRPYASCFNCLRTHKNQFAHENLDRYDALKILKQLLNVNEEPEAIEENRIQENPPEGYELFDENIYEPQGQSCYLRNNLNDSVMFDESIHNRADIVWIEKE